LALIAGGAVLKENPDLDVIFCLDSTALLGQLQKLKEVGLTARDVTVTGFATPNSVSEFAKEGLIDRWGMWDSRLQGALVSHVAFRLASGDVLKVGQVLNVPDVGLLEVMPNMVLDQTASTDQNTGVILLPRRLEFTPDKVDSFDSCRRDVEPTRDRRPPGDG
jgi:AI-2 transport system substrate-binding protein